MRRESLYEKLGGKKKGSRLKRLPLWEKAGIPLLAAALILSAVFTYAPSHHPRVPGWDDLYRRFGLYGGSSKLDGLPFAVSFLNVGQGDSTLIRADGHFLLVDSGSAGQEQAVIQALRRNGCSRLDAVIVTHPHEDHMGALPVILREVPAESVCYAPVPESALENPAADCAWKEAAGLHRRKIRAGECFSLGKANVRVLGPLGSSFENLNNCSVVLRITYGKIAVLLTGDAEREEEFSLLRQRVCLRADILKCGHHGSRTSSSLPFLRAVHPRYAVISCGKGNAFGHPHAATLRHLRLGRAGVFRTDRQGTVQMGSDGEKIFIETDGVGRQSVI